MVWAGAGLCLLTAPAATPPASFIIYLSWWGPPKLRPLPMSQVSLSRARSREGQVARWSVRLPGLRIGRLQIRWMNWLRLLPQAARRQATAICGLLRFALTRAEVSMTGCWRI
jgi:hypothetical protein